MKTLVGRPVIFDSPSRRRLDVRLVYDELIAPSAVARAIGEGTDVL